MKKNCIKWKPSVRATVRVADVNHFSRYGILKKQIIPKDDRDWIKVWKESIDNLPHAKRFDLTDEQIEKEGKVKAASAEYNPSPVAQREMLNRHKEKVNEARRKYYLSANPGASEEEINEYLKKFDLI